MTSAIEASPANRFVVRQTVSERLVTNLDLLGASPRRRHIRDAAHVEMSSDFGEPRLPTASSRQSSGFLMRATQSERAPYASTPKCGLAADCTPCGSTPKRALAEELNAQLVATPIASTATPATARSVMSTPGSARVRPNFGTSGFGSPSSRKSLAEMELLVAEVGADIQSLELQTSCTSPSGRRQNVQDIWKHSFLGLRDTVHSGTVDAVSCAKSVAGQLKYAAQRARALEADVLPSERLQLATLRTTIAELQLRFERILSSVSPVEAPEVSDARTDATSSPTSRRAQDAVVRFEPEDDKPDEFLVEVPVTEIAEPEAEQASGTAGQEDEPGIAASKEELPAMPAPTESESAKDEPNDALEELRKEVSELKKQNAELQEQQRTNQKVKSSVADEAERFEMKAQVQDLRQKLEQAEAEARAAAAARRAQEVELKSMKDALEDAKRKLEASSKAQEVASADAEGAGGPSQAD